MTPNPLLVDAIDRMRRLRFTYNEKPRLVEPQCYGIGAKGTELLRAHVRRGGRNLPAALFDVAKIVGLEALDETFDRPGPGYRRDDSAMQEIFAQL